MKKDFAQFRTAVEIATKEMRMTGVEKEALKINLTSYMHAHPVRIADDLRQLYQKRSNSSADAAHATHRQPGALFRPLLLTFSRMTLSATILLIAALASGATTFAAEGALPGDTLYPVKVGLNEQVRDWLAVSNESQADWDARRAERRLEELEKLFADGRLTDDVKAEIAGLFEGHLDDFKESMIALHEDEETRAYAEAQSGLEASLSAHEKILEFLANKNLETEAQLQTLINDVRAEVHTAAEARAEAEASITVNSQAEFQTGAEAKRAVAERKLADVRKLFDEKKSTLNEKTRTEAEATLSAVATTIALGDARFNAQAYAEAFIHYQEAARVATEVHVLLQSIQRLDLSPATTGFGATSIINKEELLKPRPTSTRTNVSSSIDITSGLDVHVFNPSGNSSSSSASATTSLKLLPSSMITTKKTSEPAATSTSKPTLTVSTSSIKNALDLKSGVIMR